MVDHDPLKFASGLSAKIASRARHVCIFLGAGASRACGLPDVAALQQFVLQDLGDTKRDAFQNQLKGRNLERALSRLRRMEGLLADGQNLDGLTKDTAKELDIAVCESIVQRLDASKADLAPMYHLAAWVARASYRLPIELFTINYDLLTEIALEKLRVPFFDGFTGILKARFHTELVEGDPGANTDWVPSFFVRLWKLHGSVNWIWDEHEILRLGQSAPTKLPAAIYPSEMKYEESRRMPFVVLHDRFRRALKEPETLVLITGYSFSDEHLNELIFDAASRRERSEFIVLCYSEIPDSLAVRASATPNLQVATGKEAIIAGVRAPWKKPTDFQPNIWVDDQFAFRDFRQLTAYLARSSARDAVGEQLNLALSALNPP
jgi:hypothetical protein